MFARAEAVAKAWGATIQSGINWTWATGFRSPEDGQAFVKYLDSVGMEHRGYYPASPESSNSNLRVDGVRFR